MKRSLKFLTFSCSSHRFYWRQFPLFIISRFHDDRQAQILLFLFNCFENFHHFRQKYSNRFIELYKASWIDHSLRIDAVIKMTMCDKRAIIASQKFYSWKLWVKYSVKIVVENVACLNFLMAFLKCLSLAGHRWFFYSQFLKENLIKIY